MEKGKIIKPIMFILAGIIISLLLLVLYSRLFTPSLNLEEGEIIPPVNLTEKDVFITAITGEVFIIRDEILYAAVIGQPLLEGDVLKVVDQSYCQIQFSDRGTAGLDSNTIMFMKKLVNAESLSIRTEVLMGSMMYRVKRLSERDQFQVESEGVIYDVKGTEFLIISTKEGSFLAVKEGEVTYSSALHNNQSVPVVGGEEIFLSRDSLEIPLIVPMGERASQRMERLEGLNILNSVDNPIVITVRVNPPNAEIYLDGRKSGTGGFIGLFEEGSEINLLIRKSGYIDQSHHITAGSGENEIIQIDLLPAGLNNSLAIRNLPIETLLENKLVKTQDELFQLKESYLDQKKSYEGIEELKESLTTENSELKKEIENKNEEISQLKKLMIQIRDLSDQ